MIEKLKSWLQAPYLHITAAGIVIAASLFLIYRVYDIGGDRREKQVMTAWRLADADREKQINIERELEQAESDRINAEKTAERVAIIKRSMDADYKKRLRDELANAAYDAVIPAGGVQLYREAVFGNDKDKGTSGKP